MAVEILHSLSRCCSEGRVTNRAEFESKLQALVDVARSGDGRHELAESKAVSTLLSLSSGVFPSTREALYEPYWSFKSFNLYVKVLRNLCAGNAVNQEALVDGLEAIAPVVEILARECSATSDNGESPAESIVRTSAIESLQMVLQLLGNVAGLGEYSQARIWKRFFPSVFQTVADVSSEKMQGPLCMILSTCCKDNDIRRRELSEGKGAPIVSLLLNGGARGVTKSAPNEWLESLIARLCFESTCFPLLFRELGKGTSFSKEQASLLDILNASLSSREGDHHSDEESTNICMPLTSASYLIDIIRSAAECAAITNLSVLQLPTNSPVADVLGLTLSITRILCVLDTNRSAILPTFASSGLIPLLLDLLRALGPPDNAKPSTGEQSSDDDAKAQRFPRRDVYTGYRRDIVAVIANASHRSFTIQEAVRESGGLLVVLQQCMPDTNNPFLREWGLWAIRNSLEGNSANQTELAELEIRSVVPDSRLQDAGMTVEINPETGRPRLVNAAPSTANPTVDEFM